jgi:hypothetical protein
MRLTRSLGWLALVAGLGTPGTVAAVPQIFMKLVPGGAGAARISLPTRDCWEETYSVPTRNADGFVARPD